MVMEAKRGVGVKGVGGVEEVEEVGMKGIEGVEGEGRAWKRGLEKLSEGGVKVRPRCPWCGGETFKDGFVVTRKGRKQRYQCKSCGHKFTL
jgi:tRNA(Ile2) C34 agmatinyltransferase TiaS